MQSVTAAGGYPVCCWLAPPLLVPPSAIVKVTVHVDPDTTTADVNPTCVKWPQ